MKRKNVLPVPPFRVHKATGQAYVRLDGRRVYLGRHDRPETKARYDRMIAEWLAAGRRTPVAPTDITIVELAARYLSYADTYYRKPDGTPTGEADHFATVLRPMKELYGDTRAVEFGPLALKAVRERMIGTGKSRTYVNSLTARVKRLFKWAVAEELIPASVLYGLQAVTGLRRGRTEARETEPIRPVSDAMVDATLPYLTPTVRAMVELQRLTGMRPGEVCRVRTCDIDTSGKVWTYTPERHKTQYAGKSRVVYLGPKAQAVLKPLLRHDLQAYVFSPAQADAERRARLHAERVTPLSCGNKPGSNVKRHAKKQPGERYDSRSYHQAVTYACEKAHPLPNGLDTEAARRWRKEHHWHPNQLRHSFGTAIRREYGLEAAQVCLGHTQARVTEVYAERDAAKAAKVAMRIG